MKIIQAAIVAIALTHVCSCQEIRERSYRLNVEVKDPESNPVSGVKVITGKIVLAQGGAGLLANPVTIESDATDSSGKIELAYKSLPEPSGKASIYGDGYYTSSYAFGWKSPEGSGGPARVGNIEAVLKPVKKPIPMKTRRDLRIRTPEFGVSYGFDLEMGESLPPLGNGKNADIEFILTGTRRDVGTDKKEYLNFQMEIGCPNPDDGFIEFEIEDSREFSIGSDFQSAYECPPNGYTNKITRRYENDKDGGAMIFYKIMNEIRNMSAYFRVRTKRNESGEIVSANYGKMYGPMEIRPALKQYDHYKGTGQGGFYIQYLYFNPIPNDRNVEFDPKHNLVPEQNVTEP